MAWIRAGAEVAGCSGRSLGQADFEWKAFIFGSCEAAGQARLEGSGEAAAAKAGVAVAGVAAGARCGWREQEQG